VVEKIRAHLEQEHLTIRRAAEGNFEALNPRMNSSLHFTDKGAVFSKSGAGAPGWQFGISLARYGYAGHLQATGAGALQAEANRLSYRRGGMEEWYVNTPGGVEQGFTLAQAPKGGQAGDLVFDIAVSGSLAPRLSEDKGRLLLCDSAGAAVLTYSKLAAFDADGRKLPSAMSLAGPEGRTIRLSVDDTGAAYPVVVDPLVQSAKLTADDAAAFDYFGYTVSISGDLAVVGARQDDDGGSNSGAAYIFARDQGGADNWGQVQKLTVDDAEAYDYFGHSVSISGDLAVVGAPNDDDGGSNSGAAYIFARDQGGADNWGQVQKLTADDAEASDRFGRTVSISGDLLMVGAPNDDDGGSNSGAAYIFARDQGGADNWGQVQKLSAVDAEAGDEFGYNVSISAGLAVVGAPYEDDGGSSSGSAYIFAQDQGGADNWGQVQKLSADDAGIGDEFGYTVSISGDLVVVGAPNDDDGGGNSGSAYIFAQDQGGADNWGQVQKLTADDAADGDCFGWSVSISGDLAMVGAPYEDNGGSNSGAAYTFARDQGGADNWGQVEKLTADTVANDLFGYTVSISDDLAAVGAHLDDDGGNASGSVYLFAFAYATIQVSPTSGLGVTEDGGTATFTVVLGSEPSDDVTIALSSGDTGEAVVSPTSLTFTADDWDTEQTVTVTGVDDDDEDGDQDFTITLAAAESSDALYDGLDPDDVSVTCSDDDAPGDDDVGDDEAGDDEAGDDEDGDAEDGDAEDGDDEDGDDEDGDEKGSDDDAGDDGSGTSRGPCFVGGLLEL
jgi:hypothetical protein